MVEMLGNTEEKRRHAVAQRFEDLEVWQKSFELTAEVYEAFEHCRDFGLKDQITRSALSEIRGTGR